MALVGALYDDINSTSPAQGSVYPFEWDHTGWKQHTKLIADDGIGGDVFGSSVTLNRDGNVALVGAPTAVILLLLKE